MESQNLPPSETKATEVQQPSGLKTDLPGMLSKPSGTEPAWQEWIDIGVDFLSKLPDEVGVFFADYKRPLLTALLIVSGIVTVYITLAVLDAIDDIPLLAPLLELVGLAYTTWFVYRYLLKASTRSELLAEFDAFKSQVVGKDS